MTIIETATCTVNQIPLDWPGNTKRLVDCITEAKEAGASLICLPELAITGYGCEDQFLSPHTCEMALQQLAEIATHTTDAVVAVGLPLLYQNAVYNTVAVLAAGKVLGFFAKQNLAGDGIHYEPRWFRPWQENVVCEVEVNGHTVPVGDLIFEIGGVRIGFEVCEDAWVADRPGRRYAECGVDVILNPSASHFAFGKQRIRQQFVCEGSRAFGTAYVYANLSGNEAGRAIYDGGAMIANGGEIRAEGPRFPYVDHTVTTAAIDLDINRLAQAKSAARDIDLIGPHCVKADFDWPHAGGPAPIIALQTWTKEVEFTRAVTLGLYDYMRKSYSNGFVVSLSGGADSAAVVTLIHLMKTLVEAETDKVLPPMKDLLICAYQASANSGEVTRNAAETLANAIGADYTEWQIEENVQSYIRNTEGTIGRSLTWEQDDITLQNIQARVRAPGVWMLANLRGALLLSTSNRSEAAVGYATMDGDTSGGLSPVSGIDKAYLRHWLRWLETEGAEDIPKLPELSVINSQAPTAELRPADQEQTDEGDLMPYPILDLIERLAIRDKKSPAEVLSFLKHRFPDRENKVLTAYVIRFFKLWCRNQWKRERYAPGFHLDDENLDPKSWCRFPILNSGFATELAQLENQ